MTLKTLLLSLLVASPPAAGPTLRDGDLVFQTSRSAQSAAVARATGSRLTHMGVVLLDGGEPWVLEAVEPVKLTRLDEWRRRGAGGRLRVKRLRDADTVLDPATVARLRALGRSWIGRRYDLQFRWDDERLYCSELAWKLYDRSAGVRLGRMQRAGDLALGSPEVQRKLRERFGPGAFDPAEPVVTPQAIFDDRRLVEVPLPDDRRATLRIHRRPAPLVHSPARSSLHGRTRIGARRQGCECSRIILAEPSGSRRSPASSSPWLAAARTPRCHPTSRRRRGPSPAPSRATSPPASP